MEEIWKVIVDDGITKDKYVVSNLGNVKVILTNHIVPIQDSGLGYKKRGKTNQLTPHQIKEIAFKRFGKMGVNEIAVSMGIPRTTVSSVINGRSHWDIYCSALKEAEVCLATLEEKN